VIEQIQDGTPWGCDEWKLVPIVAGDDDGASPGLFALFDEVDLVQTFSFVGDFQLLGQLVIADTAGVDDRVGGQHVLMRKI
jgi:hypothetical protein